MKKILNYLVAIALVLFQLMPVANAASITINNSVAEQEYKAYKIFDVTNTGDSYAYSIDSESNDWFEVVKAYANSKKTLKLTPVGETSKYVVEELEEFDAADFAKTLNENKDGKTVAGSTTAKEGTTTVIDGLTPGYYFVDSSLGSLCILHTTTDELTVNEKNQKPTVDKTPSVPSASVGETITYTINITAGGNAETSYILHDRMSEGLTLKEDSFTIKVDGKDVATTNYEIKTEEKTHSDCTFEIVFNLAYTATLKQGDVITITYEAIVNEKAITDSVVNNEAQLQYGNSYSEETTEVPVYNYDFDLVKTDGTKELDGAQFKLYDQSGKEIKLTYDGTFYRPVVGEEEAVDFIEAGSVSIKGLASGTYFLEETKAPEGYNQLTERVEINLNGDLTLENAIKVVNTTGSLLPDTGGMGTVLFVTIGMMMVLGFGVLLVTKLRLSKMSI